MLALYLAGLGVLTWGLLHAFDAVRAWRYNRRMAHARAVADAYEIGKRFAMGDYAKGATWFIVTQDRPAPELRTAIEAITSREDAANYPKGS
jgi:hypothetical protein